MLALPVQQQYFIPAILLPATPRVGAVSTVCTTAMALAVLTAGLAFKPVSCAPGTASMIV